MILDPRTLVDVFALLFVLVALLVWRALRRFTADETRKSFDVADLWMENGHVSKQAVLLLGSWGGTTWAFLYVTLTTKFDSSTLGPYTTFLLTYGGLWVSPLLARIVKGIGSTPADPAPPAGASS